MVVEEKVAAVLIGFRLVFGHDLLDVLGQSRVGEVGESWDLRKRKLELLKTRREPSIVAEIQYC